MAHDRMIQRGCVGRPPLALPAPTRTHAHAPDAVLRGLRRVQPRHAAAPRLHQYPKVVGGALAPGRDAAGVAGRRGAAARGGQEPAGGAWRRGRAGGCGGPGTGSSALDRDPVAAALCVRACGRSGRACRRALPPCLYSVHGCSVGSPLSGGRLSKGASSTPVRSCANSSRACWLRFRFHTRFRVCGAPGHGASMQVRVFMEAYGGRSRRASAPCKLPPHHPPAASCWPARRAP